jgi:glucose/arabinose dehydrogenase
MLAACLVLLQSSCGGGGYTGSSPPPTTPPTTPTGNITLSVTRVFASLPAFAMPVGALQAPGDSSRWFVVEQSGHLKVFQNQASASTAADFLDISDHVTCCGELGLLGVAFHPGFPNDPRVYVSYTTTVGAQLVSRLSEFRTADSGVTLDAASETVLLQVNQPETNHKGGHVVFGPDGMLYLGFGDGGGGGDVHGTIGNGQDLNTLLGKMLRIDVGAVGDAYAIPNGNPYSANAKCGSAAGPGTGAAPCAEIYAYGLRNPWQYSVDSAGGALWIGDVGQDAWEEIDRISAPANLGWRCREGAHVYNANCGPATDLVDPVAEYPHNPEIAVTGGFVYRGSAYPDLVGQYVCADYGTGKLFYFDAATSASSTLEMTGAGSSGINPSAFAQGSDGELYLLDYGSGAMSALVATSSLGTSEPRARARRRVLRRTARSGRSRCMRCRLQPSRRARSQCASP